MTTKKAKEIILSPEELKANIREKRAQDLKDKAEGKTVPQEKVDLEKKKSETRKKRATVKRGGVTTCIKIRNNMMGIWYVPPQLIASQEINAIKDNKRKKDIVGQLRKALNPNEVMIIQKAAFDNYHRGCLAFRAMIDLKHLSTSLEAVPDALLTHIKPPAPPAILQQPMSGTAVEVNTGKAAMQQALGGVVPVNSK